MSTSFHTTAQRAAMLTTIVKNLLGSGDNFLRWDWLLFRLPHNSDWTNNHLRSVFEEVSSENLLQENDLCHCGSGIHHLNSVGVDH